jgi:hypothetical protein
MIYDFGQTDKISLIAKVLNNRHKICYQVYIRSFMKRNTTHGASYHPTIAFNIPPPLLESSIELFF